MSARKTGTTLATLVFLGGMAAALLLPQALVAQGGLILCRRPRSHFKLLPHRSGESWSSTKRVSCFDIVHADIVHAITICPGDSTDRAWHRCGHEPAISIVDLGRYTGPHRRSSWAILTGRVYLLGISACLFTRMASSSSPTFWMKASTPSIPTPIASAPFQIFSAHRSLSAFCGRPTVRQ